MFKNPSTLYWVKLIKAIFEDVLYTLNKSLITLLSLRYTLLAGAIKYMGISKAKWACIWIQARAQMKDFIMSFSMMDMKLFSRSLLVNFPVLLMEIESLILKIVEFMLIAEIITFVKWKCKELADFLAKKESLRIKLMEISSESNHNSWKNS